jgi:hypothetical protein
MHSTTLRRPIAIGALAMLGATCAFLVGARAGAALNGHVNSISIARTPIPRIQPAVLPLAELGASNRNTASR